MTKRKLILATIFEILFVVITLFGRFSNETYSQVIFIIGLIAVIVFPIAITKNAIADALHEWINKR